MALSCHRGTHVLHMGMEISYHRDVSEENHFVRAVGITTATSSVMPQPASPCERQHLFIFNRRNF